MPLDVSPGSFAAVTITALFWWTVLSPVALLTVAALCARRPRLRGALTLSVLVPPVVTLLPVAVLHQGLGRIAAAVAVVLLGVAIGVATAALLRAAASAGLAERRATAALLLGVAGGMLGSVALVGALLGD